MKHLSVFSWGFWGWGTATSQLVSSVDAAERKRGFNPPIFVDIRFRRAGRAPGFKERAFEDLLGWRRYRWMPTLGNSSIGTRKSARIACPMSANQLLDVVLEGKDRSARVIFFCACESPANARYCHRRLVAQLLLRSARRRNVSLNVNEWPGGQPSFRPLTLRVSPETLYAVARGAKAVPLNRKKVPMDFAGIPWGTLVTLKAGRDELPAAVGPAAYRLGHWVLPRFQEENGEPAQDTQALRRQTTTLRRKYGLD